MHDNRKAVPTTLLVHNSHNAQDYRCIYIKRVAYCNMAVLTSIVCCSVEETFNSVHHWPLQIVLLQGCVAAE